MSQGRKHLTEAEREERRTHLLNTVEKLFQVSDFYGSKITMQKIARKAGIAKGTIYLYFKTKEELIFAAYIRFLLQRQISLQQLFEKSQEPLTRFRSFLDFYYSYYRNNPHYLKIQLYCEGPFIDKRKIKPQQQEVYQQISYSNRDWVMKIMQECQDEGVFRKDLNIRLSFHNLSTALRSILQVCLFTFDRHYLHLVEKVKAKDYYDNFVDLLIAGMQ